MASVRILNGPNRDQLFPLKGGEVCGRDPANTIQVFAPGVSRRHFQFTCENGVYYVQDLGSSNGTYVNNVKITKHALIDNDRITVGGIEILYQKGDGAPSAVKPVGSGTAPAIPAALPSRRLSFSQEDLPVGGFGGTEPAVPATPVAKPDPGIVIKDDAEGEESAADFSLDASVIFAEAPDTVPQKDQVSALKKRLTLMFEISQDLGAIRERDQLLGRIMEKLFDVFPQADRGFMLVGPDVEHLEPAVKRHRKPGESEGQVQISRTIARKVYGEKQAILSQNAMEDDRFSGGLSILNFRILSMMCAPLVYRNEVFGFIHLDTQDRAKKFTPDDLSLLTGIAANAAIFLKNQKLFDEVAKEAEARTTLQRYFSPELAKKIVSKEIDLALGGATKTGTVFFSDIIGFTTMSESMEPAAVITKINRYMCKMVDIVFKHHGNLDKFMGDAIMAVWGTPVALRDDAVHAVTAGLEMQNSVFLLNSEFHEEHDGPINMGIGLNSGNFIAGNMGSEKRMEYTHIGDNVNLAQRIEGKAGRGNVYVAESTFQRAPGKLLAVKLKPTMVKGKTKPITIYSTRGVITPSRDAQPVYITSMPFRLGAPEGPEGLLIKAKLLGDNLVLGLALFHAAVRNERQEIFFELRELPPFSVSLDLQGEVPSPSKVGKCMKGVFSVAGTPLEELFAKQVMESDKTPEDLPRSPAAAAAAAAH